MLHELLLALNGISGGIFKDSSKGLQVVKGLPFLHLCEAEQLEEICKFGSLYQIFQNFIKDYGTELSLTDKYRLQGKEEKPLKNGQYLKAFAVGLGQILHPYRKTLINLENEILRDPHISLSYIKYAVDPYFFLFRCLAEIIYTIETEKRHGCSILELLYQHCSNGAPSVKEPLQQILHVCHSVLYKQLSAWMIHGMLIDNQKEFFITDTQPIKTNGEVTNEQVTKEDEKTRSLFIIRGITGREVEKLKDIDKDLIPNETPTFFLEPSMLPSYIEGCLAEKILFIGQTINMFKDSGNSWSSSFNRKAKFLQGREREFLEGFRKLQENLQFSLQAFEREIDKIKGCVTEQLWTLVVEEGKLIKHLKFLKDMYLLGRGELYLTFVDHTENMLKAPPSEPLSYDLNASFEQSMRKILLNSEEYDCLFTMSLDISQSNKDGSKDSKEQGTSISSWDYVRLNYTAPWPLHLLFSKTVMERYNTVFRFLLQVNRTQLYLQNVWALQMTNKRSSKENKGLNASSTWSLRRQMAFLIDNLQYYLQVDVLEAQFSLLLEKIEQTRDFESIEISHDFYITTLLAQSFISMKVVFLALNELLAICRVFCELITMYNHKWTEREQLKVEELSLTFHRQSSLLFKILSSVRSQQTAPHLAQLLLRIDFNKYFTQNTI